MRIVQPKISLRIQAIRAGDALSIIISHRVDVLCLNNIQALGLFSILSVDLKLICSGQLIKFFHKVIFIHFLVDYLIWLHNLYHLTYFRYSRVIISRWLKIYKKHISLRLLNGSLFVLPKTGYFLISTLKYSFL